MLLEQLVRTFYPPKHILNKIEFKEDVPYILKLRNFLVGAEDRNAQEKAESIFFSLEYLLVEKYGEQEWNGEKRGNLRNIEVRLFWESLKNAFEHGNKNDPEKHVVIVLYLGEKGLMFGFRDEGDFYKKAPIKFLIESRIGVCSTRIESPGGSGTRNFKKAADEIFVDTETGTLYLCYLLEKENRIENWGGK